MNHNNIKKLNLSALFTALCCSATMIIQIPSPIGGYLNAGDAVVLLSAYFLGPVWGAAAAGIGSALADLFAGYPIWAPGTLIIKAAIACVSGSLFIKMSASSSSSAKTLIAAAIPGELIMILGYLIYSLLVLKMPGAFAEIPGNAIQAVFGTAVSSILYLALVKIPYVKRLLCD